MKNIIRKNVKSVDHNKDITTIIYYCNRNVNNIIMTNNLNRNEDPLAMSHVVCEIKCPVGGCELLNPVAPIYVIPKRVLGCELVYWSDA